MQDDRVGRGNRKPSLLLGEDAMGSEVDERPEPCRCGKGEIVRISRSDDWRHYGSKLEIRCEACREAGFIVVQVSDCKETWEEVYHRDKWAERQKREALAQEEAARKYEEEERLRRAANEVVRAQLGAQFIALFSHLKTKKALWEVLKPIRCYIGIQTQVGFDSLVREVGRDEALRRGITVENQHYIEALIKVGIDSGLDLHVYLENVRMGKFQRISAGRR